MRFIYIILIFFIPLQALEILTNTSFKTQIRPRFEYANFYLNQTKAASAYTARASMMLSTELFGFKNLEANLSLNSVSSFGSKKYSPLNKNYDTINDTNGVRFSNALFAYNFYETYLKVGIEELNINNERFIGSDDFRQTPQSFNLIGIDSHLNEDIEFQLYYIYAIQGVDIQDKIRYGYNIVTNLDMQIASMINLQGYIYMLGSYHNTYGLSLSGEVKGDNSYLKYRFESAYQGDATLNNSPNIVKIPGIQGKPTASSFYYNALLDIKLDGTLFAFSYESLGSSQNSNPAFYTPLASLHKFNGDADLFLNTPDVGLQDIKLKLGYDTSNLGKLYMDAHYFSSTKEVLLGDKTTQYLGSELDFHYMFKNEYIKGFEFDISSAYFFGGDIDTPTQEFTKDVFKVFVMADYIFQSEKY